MFRAIFLTHLISVNIFLIVYLVKTILLVSNKNTALAKFTKVVKVPEMIVSTLFLLTGVYLIMQTGASKLLIIKIIFVLVSIPLAVIGFKKGNKILAVLSMLLIIMAYGFAEMNKKKIVKQEIDPVLANASLPTYDILKHGAALYSAYCQSCHGVEGANGAGGINLTISQKNMEQMKEQVRKGKSSMPPYKDFLNDQEINAVVAYVMTLKK
ncbi:MAG: cytochrome c [Bacteroidota bacterium]